MSTLEQTKGESSTTSEVSLEPGITSLRAMKYGGDDPDLRYRSLRSLLDRYPDFDVKGEKARSTICQAAAECDLPLLKALVDHGVDINSTWTDGTTPLHEALEGVMMLKRPEDPGPNVCASGMQAFDWLLSKNINVHLRRVGGFTVLHTAMKYAHPAAVQRLLDAGVCAQATTNQGETALHYLCFRASRFDGHYFIKPSIERHTSILRMLLQAGLDANAKTKHGRSPLHVLVMHRDSDSEATAGTAMAEILIAHGADPYSKDERGMTPLGWVVSLDEWRQVAQPEWGISEIQCLLQKHTSEWMMIAKTLNYGGH